MATENSTRFLSAFIEVETELRRLSGVARGDLNASFAVLVDQAADRSAAVRRFRHDLREFAELRNAIVHERRDGVAIAEPHLQTVVEMEIIRDQLLRPVRLEERFLKPVVACSPEDPVGAAAEAMYNGGFSQVPVYSGTRHTALLTAETIARWLGAQLKGGLGLVEEVSVGEVLGYTEEEDHWQLVSRRRAVADVIELFDNYAATGKSLDAVIITETGDKSEAALGILTIFDLPALYRSLARRAA